MFISFRRYVTGLGIIMLIFAGCDRPTDFQPDDNPQIMESSFGEATLGEGTTIVDEETMEKLTGISEDGTVFIFRGTDPILEAIAQKEFLVMGQSVHTPLGALRRIEEVRKDDDTYIVTTSDATIEQAFENLELRYNESLNPYQVDSIVYKVPSLDIHKKMTRKTHPEVLDIAFNISIDQDFDGISIGGQLVMKPDVDFHMKIRRFRLRELRMVIENELENELVVTSGASQGIKAEQMIFDYWLKPIPLSYVIVTPKITVNVGIEGEARAGITSGIEVTVTMEGGLEYNAESWKPVSNFETDYSAAIEESNVNASLKAHLGPQMDFFLYGVAGPFVGVEGYGEMTWDMNRNPRYQVHAGIAAAAGVKMDIISRVTLSYTLPELFSYRRLVYETGFHDDDEGDITINTKPVTNITSTSAQSGGDIADDGGLEILLRGVCWSTDPEPDLSGQCTEDGDGTGTYSSHMSGLAPSTSYFIRAYATNDAGTSYGNQVQFFTDEGIDDVPPGVNDFLDPEDIDSLRDKGLSIHTGLNPPDIQGNYYMDSLTEIETGWKFINYSFRFFNQTSDLKVNASYISEGGTDVAEGIGAFIAGNDQKFSVFVEEKGTVDFGTHVAVFNTATIYSGIKTHHGLEDFQFGFIVTHKENDLNNQLMNVGDTRVIYEADGLAEQVPNFPHEGIPAKLLDKQLRMLIGNQR